MHSKTLFTPNIQTMSLIIFAIGIITTFALLIAAIVSVAWLLNLAMSVVCEIAGHISTLYSGSDSFTRLLIICIIGYALARVARSAYRSLRK
jgi:vacuolar-type H+-ATPase subunit I/STV1